MRNFLLFTVYKNNGMYPRIGNIKKVKKFLKIVVLSEETGVSRKLKEKFAYLLFIRDGNSEHANAPNNAMIGGDEVCVYHIPK